ncbi:DEP domain-containing protein [Crocosphaera sp.]|uniref:DEP domain-containing protein n=1 Tax=Crocosphaera sp. TaxID=2729996 RepID=UPI003F2403E1|nr:pleckstrin/ G-protein interacting- domain protein [Crocosphaera sp.]
MKILDHKQVRYCNLVQQEEETTQYLPGLIFKNKLFIKDKLFIPEQQKEAQEYGKKKFLENKGQIEYLLLEDVTGFIIWKESNEVELYTNGKKKDQLGTIDLDQLIQEIRSDKGVTIKNRRYRLKLYPQCFIGSELVDWLTKNLSITVEEAVKIGQQLVDKKIIHHVHNEHQFQNDYLFYRFYVDE